MADSYWDWPGAIELAPYPPDMPPEEMSNPQWAQWAYDNKSPKWAIEVGLARRTPPVLSGIEPTTAAIGDPSFELKVSGSNFHTGSVIMFAGQAENTTLNEDGTLSTGVNMSYWHGSDTVPVAVNNGDVASDPVDFTFTEAAAAPEAEPEAASASEADPDDLEEEIEEATDDGEVKTTKRRRKRR